MRPPSRTLPPIRVLGAVYRGKFLDELSQALAAGRLTFQGSLAPLSAGRDFRRLVCKLRTKPWVVYAKRPFAGPQVVLKYLARYTHRVAISNRRLLSLAAGQVRFRWRDYRTGRRWRVLTLPAVEFIRRFLLHTLPRGFVRIRHFGILANRCREARLLLCRHLLGAAAGPAPCIQPTSEPDAARCPSCGRPALVRAETVKARTPAWDAPVAIDSS